MMQLNPCQPDKWLEKFKQTPYYRKATTLYDHVISSHQEMSVLKAALHHSVYERGRFIGEEYKIFDIIPHYYIQFLLEASPESILDIGCGENNFKKIYPNIIGMDADPDNPKSDVFDYFDDGYVAGHQSMYDAVMTINTIHFSSIDSIKQRLLMISQLLKPGGRAFVSTNFETWLMYTETEVVTAMFGRFPKFSDVMDYMHQEIISTGLDFLVVDYPVLSYAKESTIRDDYNGNIRLVFKK